MPLDSGSVQNWDVRRRCRAAHKDDRIIVKIVTGLIFMLLPGLASVGVWAACLLYSTKSKSWYEVYLESPVKLPFYIFGGIWCGTCGTTGFTMYWSWYEKGCRRFAPYLLLGTLILSLAYSYPPLLLVGHFILYSFIATAALWLLLLFSIVFFSRINIMAGLFTLPMFIWTSYTVFFTFFPFRKQYLEV